jgi:hypothetical protein
VLIGADACCVGVHVWLTVGALRYAESRNNATPQLAAAGITAAAAATTTTTTITIASTDSRRDGGGAATPDLDPHPLRSSSGGVAVAAAKADDDAEALERVCADVPRLYFRNTFQIKAALYRKPDSLGVISGTGHLTPLIAPFGSPISYKLTGFWF